MKIRLIANYFGQFPRYFQLYLDTCRFNASIEWLFFTDQDMSGLDVPCNVKVIRMTMDEMKNRLQSCFPFQIRYERAWDFCAFRPVLGSVFKQELEDADYWGWCDCDLIFGNLAPVVELAERGVYDKLFPKGHLSFVKNDERLVEFTRIHPTIRQAIDLSMNGLPCVDEVAYPNVVLADYGAKQADVFPFVNLYCRHGHFSLRETSALNKVLEIEEGVDPSCIFTWKNGELVGHFAMSNGLVKRVNLAYVHFFRREMRPFVERFDDGVCYLIMPNKIIRYDGDVIDWRKIRWLDHYQIHWRYFMKRLNARFLYRKFRTLMMRT